MICKEGENRNILCERGRRCIGRAKMCILSIVLLIAGFPIPAWANSPKEVALSYDQTKHTLEVRITHPSQDPTEHFIKKVEINQDGKALTAIEYQSQPAAATFSYVYPVDAVSGSVLEVTVKCSFFGSKTERLTVGK